MTTVFPGSLDSYTAKVDNVDDVMAVDVNELQEAIVAIETELGINPAGSAVNLLTRLAFIMNLAGPLQFASATTLTISGGSITATQNRHLIDTEGAASSDNLDTITAMGAGWFLIMSTADSARDVVIRHGVDNILCTGGQNITLATSADLVIMIYDSAQNKWLAFGSTGGGLLNGTNTWTGQNTFTQALATAYSAVSAAATLDGTYQTVAVNATSGAVTITLPAAAGCTGRRYDIKKVDSSANAVTIDGNSAETIDGAATYALSAQYSSVTIISNGSGWYII